MLPESLTFTLKAGGNYYSVHAEYRHPEIIANVMWPSGHPDAPVEIIGVRLPVDATVLDLLEHVSDYVAVQEEIAQRQREEREWNDC